MCSSFRDRDDGIRDVCCATKGHTFARHCRSRQTSSHMTLVVPAALWSGNPYIAEPLHTLVVQRCVSERTQADKRDLLDTTCTCLWMRMSWNRSALKPILSPLRSSRQDSQAGYRLNVNSTFKPCQLTLLCRIPRSFCRSDLLDHMWASSCYQHGMMLIRNPGFIH